MFHSLLYSLDANKSHLIVEKAQQFKIEAHIHPKSANSVYIASDDCKLIDSFYTQYENDSNYCVFYHAAHAKYKGNVCVKKPLPKSITPNYTAPYSGTGQISAIAAYYNFPNYTPTSNSIRPTIGIMSLGGNYLSTDLSLQWSFNGQSQTVLPTVTLVPVPSTYTPPTFGSDSNADDENALDMQVIGGSCTNANIRFYSAANTFQSFVDTINQALLDNCQILSMSWGAVESDFTGYQSALNSAFQNAIQHGMVIPVSSGDGGCYPVTEGTYQIELPAGLPTTVAMGGTSLVNSIEVVWNDGGAATGGGQSIFFARPSYQTSIVPSTPILSGAFTPFPRTIPDVSFNADQKSPYGIYVNGILQGIGGTSACAPLMSGLLGIFYTLSPLGSIPKSGYLPNGFNYYLYSAPSFCFHNITVGNNNAQNPSLIPETAAAVGYNMSTGIGTIHGQNLYNFFIPMIPTPTPTDVHIHATPTPSSIPISTSPTVDKSTGLSTAVIVGIISVIVIVIIALSLGLHFGLAASSAKATRIVHTKRRH